MEMAVAGMLIFLGVLNLTGVTKRLTDAIDMEAWLQTRHRR